MAASLHPILSAVGVISVIYLSHPCLANESLVQTEGVSSSVLPAATTAPWAANLDLGWDSKYVSQGRNNLAEGGIYWLNASVQYGNLTTYALVGRGDSQAYTEWNIGLEYALNLSEHLEANLGYQRIEGYSSSRCQDNELFAELAYTAAPWLVPSVSYVYSTEAAGYFVELSLHSYWQLSESFTLAPYITQGLDFKYRTEEHNGRNHLQFGLEANYDLADNMSLSGHISHSIAQDDIELEAAANGDFSSQDQTYAGVHFNMSF
ncbi:MULTISPECIES: hypothetical protein [Shewanella]|uniref:hypothetical protein n=1 Tax=Shewanella TaxID=22 RepID=UPI001C6551CD|nr:MULTISPECIES: hypothetical protein [Shewanella]QYK09090.1 hypothetical protein K0H60_20230 [Shewanella mangrovisoli]